VASRAGLSLPGLPILDRTTEPLARTRQFPSTRAASPPNIRETDRATLYYEGDMVGVPPTPHRLSPRKMRSAPGRG
jgi:hypothetical protein